MVTCEGEVTANENSLGVEDVDEAHDHVPDVLCSLLHGREGVHILSLDQIRERVYGAATFV